MLPVPFMNVMFIWFLVYSMYRCIDSFLQGSRPKSEFYVLKIQVHHLPWNVVHSLAVCSQAGLKTWHCQMWHGEVQIKQPMWRIGSYLEDWACIPWEGWKSQSISTLSCQETDQDNTEWIEGLSRQQPCRKFWRGGNDLRMLHSECMNTD